MYPSVASIVPRPYNRDGLAGYEATHQHMYMYCPITYVHILLIMTIIIIVGVRQAKVYVMLNFWMLTHCTLLYITDKKDHNDSGVYYKR